MGTGKDKHLIFRDEEVVIPNVRVFGNGRGDLKRKAQAIWFKNTLLLPRFFHHTAFAKLGNPTESGGEYV